MANWDENLVLTFDVKDDPKPKSGERTVVSNDIISILKTYEYDLTELCSTLFCRYEELTQYIANIAIFNGRQLAITVKYPQDKKHFKRLTIFNGREDEEIYFSDERQKTIIIRVSNVHPETPTTEVANALEPFCGLAENLKVFRKRHKTYGFELGDVYVVTSTLFRHVPRKLKRNKRTWNVFYYHQPRPGQTDKASNDKEKEKSKASNKEENNIHKENVDEQTTSGKELSVCDEQMDDNSDSLVIDEDIEFREIVKRAKESSESEEETSQKKSKPSPISPLKFKDGLLNNTSKSKIEKVFEKIVKQLKAKEKFDPTEFMKNEIEDENDRIGFMARIIFYSDYVAACNLQKRWALKDEYVEAIKQSTKATIWDDISKMFIQYEALYEKITKYADLEILVAKSKKNLDSLSDFDY